MIECLTIWNKVNSIYLTYLRGIRRGKNQSEISNINLKKYSHMQYQLIETNDFKVETTCEQCKTIDCFKPIRNEGPDRAHFSHTL